MNYKNQRIRFFYSEKGYSEFSTSHWEIFSNPGTDVENQTSHLAKICNLGTVVGTDWQKTKVKVTPPHLELSKTLNHLPHPNS